MPIYAYNPQVDSWLAVLIFLIVLVGFVLIGFTLSFLAAPHRAGPIKQMPYETGVDPVGPARRRINPHYYPIALLFLLFDVELVFFYPWVGLFGTLGQSTRDREVLFAGMIAFILLLVLAFLYAGLKGVFRWRYE